MQLYFQRRSLERRLILLIAVALMALLGAILFQSLNRQLNSASVVTTNQSMVQTSRELIEALNSKAAQIPNNAQLQAQLGQAYLLRVRETGDTAYYAQAELAFDEALRLEPDQLEALIGHGVLALARHQFEAALLWAEKAQAINPFRAEITGIFVDAYVELGEYEASIVAAQQMVDQRPDISSYSRVSYVRELHGDVAGAIAAMETAVSAGVPGSEEFIWTQNQLGDLYFRHGRFAEAAAIYEEVLYYAPTNIQALAGQGRLLAVEGKLTEAIALYKEVTTRLPQADYIHTLGELYLLNDQADKAAHQFELLTLMQQLHDGRGDVEAELAPFEVDHHPDKAAVLEEARRIYAARPTVFAADTLAWALYHNGEYEEAEQMMDQAFKLGLQDALFYYHAGLIADALGKEETAVYYLEKALAQNPAFSLPEAAEAEKFLRRLP